MIGLRRVFAAHGVPRMRVVAVGVCLMMLGCAEVAPPPPQTAVAPPPKVRVAVLPIESDAFPRLAETINRQLHDVRVRGVDETFVSKVTLEVVQISIECVDPSASCYSAVGRSLSSDRLLMVQLAGG